MGLETRCHARFGRRVSEGKAHLETDRLTFRGDFRVTVPFKSLSGVRVSGERLHVKGPDGTLTLDIGTAAPKWAERIQNPRSRIDKLGVNPDVKVSVIGLTDEGFERQLREKTWNISRRLRKETVMVFLGVNRIGDLNRLDRCRRALVSDGAVWVIYPKGHNDITQSAVMGAGKRAGLVDIKVVGFSETHTALKFVIPVAKRTKK